jgi:hypothetical protein
VHKKTLDAYDKAFPNEAAPQEFWDNLTRLEKRLLAATSEKTSAVSLKAAEMAYNRGLKRICHDKPA